MSMFDRPLSKQYLHQLLLDVLEQLEVLVADTLVVRVAAAVRRVGGFGFAAFRGRRIAPPSLLVLFLPRSLRLRFRFLLLILFVLGQNSIENFWFEFWL